MARGWESKSVETQQEEASHPRGPAGRAPTREEREREAEKRTLELALVKVRGDLARSTSEAHREMLRRALEDLERRLTNPACG